MVPISMSRGSKVTVSWNGAPFVSWPLCPLVLMIRNGLRELWFAQRQQRLLFQLDSKEPEPDSTQCEDRNQGQNGRRGVRKNARRKLRLGQPEKIEAAHGYHPHSDLRKNCLAALHITG